MEIFNSLANKHLKYMSIKQDKTVKLRKRTICEAFPPKNPPKNFLIGRNRKSVRLKRNCFSYRNGKKASWWTVDYYIAHRKTKASDKNGKGLQRHIHVKTYVKLELGAIKRLALYANQIYCNGFAPQNVTNEHRKLSSSTSLHNTLVVRCGIRK